MLIKIVVIIMMLTIVLVLFSGIIALINGQMPSNKTVKALTWRIALSVILFLFLCIAFKLHWIMPHELRG